MAGQFDPAPRRRPARTATRLLRALPLLLLAALLPAEAESQTNPGRYELEFEGALTGGVTGVGAAFGAPGGTLVVDLPPVSRSYPSVRLTRDAGTPDRPVQVSIGGADGFALRFEHPQLDAPYAADAGSVRLTQVEGGRLVGEFSIVASPVGQPGLRDLRLRGRFEAPLRR